MAEHVNFFTMDIIVHAKITLLVQIVNTVNMIYSYLFVKYNFPFVKIAVCSTILCKNDGTCIESGLKNPSCLCPSGYLGNYCEIASE